MSEEQTRLRAIAESFNRRMNEVDIEGERAFIDEVLSSVTEPNVKIPEPVFREIFLPYFTGEKQSNTKENAIAHWMGLVGSSSDAADVVDVKGNVLFQVPPMYDSSKLNVIRGEERSVNFASIFEVYEDQSKIHPQLGKKFLAEELAVKAHAALPGKENSNSWLPALRYYKLVEEGPVTGASKAQPDDDDLILGDD